MSIVTAVAVVTVIGLLGAAILVVAAHFMHVEEDPRVGEVLGVLPESVQLQVSGSICLLYTLTLPTIYSV